MVALGGSFTFTVAITDNGEPQLGVMVYCIMAVPAAIPVTKPEPFTLARLGVRLDQAPPAVTSVNCTVPPTHASAGSGVIVARPGNAFTTISIVVLFVHPFASAAVV